jgi:signal peptide peptidase SppA
MRGPDFTKPWAVREEKLREISESWNALTMDEKAKAGLSLGSRLAGTYDVVNGVAVLNVNGSLGKAFDIYMAIFGGSSTQELEAQLAEAIADDSVHSLVLNIDSPGGDVDGTQALADAVYAARQKKPIMALADGQMTSAAYWIGSAADEVFLAGDTTIVGSIGVVAFHADMSRAYEQRGVKVTEVKAGKYKRVGTSPYAPLSADGQQALQDMVDHFYSVFVDEVARNRGVSTETVISDMADGRLFYGQKAIDAGLADGFATLTALIAQLNERQAARTGAIAPQGGRMKAQFTAEELEAVKATAFESGKTEGFAAGKDAGIAEGKPLGKAEGITEGAAQERERIKAVEAQALPGHEKLIAELKFDGKTSGAEAAIKVITAERAKKQQVGADLIEDAPKPVAQAEPEANTEKPEPPATEVAAKAKVYQAEQKKLGVNVSMSQAVGHVRQQLGLK